MLGVSEDTIHNYVKSGAPKIGHNQYDERLFVPWVIEQHKKRDTATLAEEQARLTKNKADLAELELAQKRGLLVSQDSVNDEYGRVVSAARSRMLSMSSKLAPVVIACTSPIDAQMAIDGAVREVLHELGTADFAKAQPVASTPEPDNEPMGGRKPRPVARGKRRAGAVGDKQG